MIEKLDHNDRLQALAEGIRPDRPPISMWRHFYVEENDPDRFVESMVNWQKRFDWDFLKINPKASYHYEPWGVKLITSPDGIIKPVRSEFPIQSVEDWAKIKPLTIRHPEFAAQLYAISRIRKALPKPFRIVMTVFNPISVAGDMVPSDQLLIDHLHESPEAVTTALEAIASTLIDLVAEMRNAGADGIFFATTQWASSDRLTVEEVRQFGEAFDQPIWKASGSDAFNILHVCDSNNYLGEYGDFHASLTNWDAGDPTNPDLKDGYDILQTPVMGGINHKSDLAEKSPVELSDLTRQLVDDHRDIPFSVGPGCAVPVTVPLENIEAVRNAVEAR